MIFCSCLCAGTQNAVHEVPVVIVEASSVLDASAGPVPEEPDEDEDEDEAIIAGQEPEVLREKSHQVHDERPWRSPSRGEPRRHLSYVGGCSPSIVRAAVSRLLRSKSCSRPGDETSSAHTLLTQANDLAKSPGDFCPPSWLSAAGTSSLRERRGLVQLQVDTVRTSKGLCKTQHKATDP